MRADDASAAGPKSGPAQLGRYELITTLGRGGMGTIYLAVAGLGDFQKLVVIKELRRDLADDKDFVRMFMHEAKLAARLNHPNVVQTIGADQVGDRYFLAMEFLDGQPFHKLLQRIRKRPKLTLPARLHIICEMLAGLHYAHQLHDYDGRSLGIVHRDVSPQNVFVTYDGGVKVVDFGIAKVTGGDSQVGTVFKGKVGYAAPEQITGAQVDRRTDIFAAGVVLWESIALRRFAGKAGPQAVEARLFGAEPRIAAAHPTVAPELARICDKALALDPAARFATAEEFRAELASYAKRAGLECEQAKVASLVTETFAVERAEMHRLIHERVHDPSDLRTTIVERSAMVAPREDDATTIADLSELAQAARRSDRPPSIPPFRSRRGARALWASAAAVLGFAVVGYVMTRTGGTPGGEPAATAASDAAAIDPTPRGNAPASPPAVRRGEPDGALVGTAAVEENPGPHARDRPARPAPARRRRPPRAVVRRPRPGAADTPASASAEPEKPPKQEARAAPTKPASRPPRSTSELGQDLRTAPKRERRSLDLDNPFE